MNHIQGYRNEAEKRMLRNESYDLPTPVLAPVTSVVNTPISKLLQEQQLFEHMPIIVRFQNFKKILL